MRFEDEQERTQGEEAESLDYVLVTRTVSTFSGPLGFYPVCHQTTCKAGLLLYPKLEKTCRLGGEW